MKFLLTSGGISNKTIENEMWRLLGGKRQGLKLLFCTTASNYSGGDMTQWLIPDLMRLCGFGFEIDVCDINGVPKSLFMPRFAWADVFYFEGGNTQWLRKCIKETGLEEELPMLLENKLWIGASAGSCVLSPTLENSVQDIFGENLAGYPVEGLGLVDFQFVPHFNNDFFPMIKEENLREAINGLSNSDGKYIYICDDNGAVSVDNRIVKVVSEGVVIEENIMG